jgi:hypothetical protein
MEQSLPPDVHRLIKQLKSPDSGQRKIAAAGLARLGCRHEKVRLVFEEAGWNDPDMFVRSEALSSLGRLGFSVRPPDGWVPAELAGTILPEAQAPDIAPEENAGQAPTGTDVEKLNLRQRFLALRYGMSPNTFELMLKYPGAALILGFLLILMGPEQKSRVLLLIGLGLFLSAFTSYLTVWF